MNSSYFILVLTFTLASCQFAGAKQQEDVDTVSASVIQFSEKNGDEDEHLTRAIISENKIRWDDGVADSNYVLYDDTTKTIYNVVLADKSVLIIQSENESLGYSAPEWQIKEVASQYSSKRSIQEGERASYYEFLLSGEPCVHAVIIKDLLNREAKLLANYFATLSNNQKHSYSEEERLIDRCSWAENTDGVARVFDYGFPVRYWSENRKQRFIVDYHLKVNVRRTFLSPPVEFRTYSVP